MRYDILHWIWNGRQGDPYMAIIDRTHHNTFAEARIPQAANFLHQIVPGQDLFFTPLSFNGKRKNENALDFDLLFADLDHMNPQPLSKSWPHLLWQTGPTTTQAIWKLSAPLETYNAWADLNQRMTYFMDADKGGWAGSKLLRVPGTINYKYDPPFQGRIISWQPHAAPYEAEALQALLPLVRSAGVVSDKHPPIIDHNEWRELFSKHWNDLSLGTKAGLLQQGAKDRSRFLLGVVNKMLAEGHTEELVFLLVWGAAWNKFRTDRHAPDYLWQIVTKRPGQPRSSIL